MTNYDTQFSEKIPGITPEERAWIGLQLDPARWGEEPPEWEAPVEEGCLPFSWSLDEVDGVLRVHAEERGDPVCAATFVRAFLRRFRPTDHFYLTYAGTCTEWHLGQCSGGAVFITKDECRHMNAHDWVRDQVEESILRRRTAGPMPGPPGSARRIADFGRRFAERPAVAAVSPDFARMEQLRGVAEEADWSDETLLDLLIQFVCIHAPDPGVFEECVAHLEGIRCQCSCSF